MRTLLVLPVGLLITLFAVAEDAPPLRVLPGIQRDGLIQLPNQWKLNPQGKQIELGDLPVNIQIHPTGQFAAVIHCGYRDHEVHIIDLNPAKRKIVCRVTVDQAFYGLTWDKEGKKLYASGGEYDIAHIWDFDRGLLHNHSTLDVAGRPYPLKKCVISGLALDPNGKDLFACNLWADSVVRVPLENPGNKVIIPLNAKVEKKDLLEGEAPSPPDGRKEDKPVVKAEPIDIKHTSFPYTCLVEPGSKRAFVSLWAKAGVAVIDLETNKVSAIWPTASHPTEMLLDPKGTSLYVACTNSTQIVVLDPATGKTRQTINAALYPQAPSGNTPNSISLTPEGDVLFVANADANNIAVFSLTDPKEAKGLGFIPVGWYPTSVRFNAKDKTIYVTNGKGNVSRSNPSGSNPERPGDKGINEYIGGLYRGTFAAIAMPTPGELAKYSKLAYECSPLQKDDAVNAGTVEADNPIPKKVGDKSPIKHVIYIIKENRTYDQVFGDIKKGNGEPSLCLFPESVTPNHHKLAEEFVLLDNTYVEGEVSADGHEWSMGAYATDFTEKIWPLGYRGGKTFGYPSEGAYDPIERPAGGYIWDRAKEAGVSYRSFGEWVTNGKKKRDGTYEDATANTPNLLGHIDPRFHGFDGDYPDVKRAERFISELQRMEKAGEMPLFQIVKLPNDHTVGTKVGKPTPRAAVADNDLALGMVVEAISNSKFWKDTAIFVIEDDTQNGPDHVDAHRSVALVISPYTKRKHVDSTLYSTSSMLRTMELILGLKPMSQFDAAARPMYHSFTAKPDATPFKHTPAQIDLKEVNKATAFGAALSEKFDLTKEDMVDDLVLSEIIWKSVKGADSPMPAPVRAAFFMHMKAKRK